jgi:DNA-binding response OmpR family regulator
MTNDNSNNQIVKIPNITIERYSNSLVKRAIIEISANTNIFNEAILIVEDDEILIEFIIDFLEKKGFKNIDKAENGLVAIKKLQSRTYKLVLLNIGIPEPNGFKVLEFINKSAQSTKTILTSGYYKEEIVTTVRELGASSFLRKPFNSDELLSIVLNTMK